MLDWTATYESPISLDASRTIGTRPRRPVLWTLAAALPTVPLLFACAWFEIPWLAAPVPIWLMVCVGMAKDWGNRPAEYWWRAMWRSRLMPRHLAGAGLHQWHAPFEVQSDDKTGTVTNTATGEVRSVVIVEQTANLRLADDQSLGVTVRRLAAFLNGLRVAVQIVVRCWPADRIERRWYIAAQADAIEGIVTGLSRAGLKGRVLNGDLAENLSRCWTREPRADHIGPSALKRERTHVTVDGELVRGFVLSKMPKYVTANWLAPFLDGDMPVDWSLWLDPTENADELEYLSARVNDWETAQVLHVTNGGYRDPDLDDQIKDAARTRMLLRRHELRVFHATMAFVIRAKDEAALACLETELTTAAREAVGDSPLIPLDFEQDRAPLLVVPVGEPAIEYPLRTVTPALARGYPFSNSSFAHPGGVDCGTSVGSKRANLLNLFHLSNPHAVVLGLSGAGKGFWIKVYLWRLLHAYGWEQRVRGYIIQAEKDEYSGMVEALNAEGAALRGAVVRITSLVDLPSCAYPKSYAAGGALRGTADLTVYDLTKMDPGERGTAVAFLLRAVEATAAFFPRTQHSVCVVDELGIVVESDEAARALEVAYRRFRSIPRRDDPRKVNRVGMIGASQRPADLLRHPRGKVLIDLAMTQVYFRQKPSGTDAAALKLTPEEVLFVESAGDGDALMVCDRARVGLHLEATAEEVRFAKT